MPPATHNHTIAGLDGIRALAILPVVWHHAHGGWQALPFSQRGFLGVDGFFVLSGLLITTLLLREQAQTGQISLRNFYIRRALRIFPLYYAVLAILFVYYSWVAKSSTQAGAFFDALPWLAAYLSNWVPAEGMMGVTWSLATEEQFYLVWPPVLALLGWRSLPVLLAFLALNQAVNFGLLDDWFAHRGFDYAQLNILQATFSPVILGVLAAFALAASPTRAWLERLLTPARLWLGVVALLVLLSLPNPDIRGIHRFLIQGVMALCLVGVVLRPTHRLVAWLQWRPLAHVGLVSYGVYLLHQLGLDLVRRVMQRIGLESPELLFLLGGLLTLLLATLSFRLFEQPLLKLKARFA